MCGFCTFHKPEKVILDIDTHAITIWLTSFCTLHLMVCGALNAEIWVWLQKCVQKYGKKKKKPCHYLDFNPWPLALDLKQQIWPLNYTMHCKLMLLKSVYKCMSKFNGIGVTWSSHVVYRKNSSKFCSTPMPPTLCREQMKARSNP